MSETRDMVLGDRTFAVPRLPIGINIKVYPLLRRLNNSGLDDRWFAVDGEPTEQDMIDITGVLFLCAQAADPQIDRAAFDAIRAPPMQMMDGVLVARYQSGGWVPRPEGVDEGEAGGEPKPQTSTSATSLES